MRSQNFPSQCQQFHRFHKDSVQESEIFVFVISECKLDANIPDNELHIDVYDFCSLDHSSYAWSIL